MSTTAYMALSLPTVSVTAGPAWATALNLALSTIDAHDHTSGKGTRVPAAGLLINADLSFGSNNATNLRTARFTSQSGTLSATGDLGCVYNVAGDLYWNNGSGTPVQITTGGSVAGASGNISGLTSPASASYDSGTGTFTWLQDANTPAIMDAGSVVVREAVTSGKGVTIAAPTGLAANYDLTLPDALPASSPAFLTVTQTGEMAVGTSLDQGITREMQAAVGQQVSATCASFFTSSLTPVDVTNLSVTITTTGRPIMLMLMGLDTASTAYLALTSSATNASGVAGLFQIAVSGGTTATIGKTEFIAPIANTNNAFRYPPSSIAHLYAAPAGTYTFTVQAFTDATTTIVWVLNTRLVAYEL